MRTGREHVQRIMEPTATLFDVEALFHSDCRRQIAQIVAASNGREVFFVGKVDESGRVADIDAYAFGTDTAVPAPIHQAQYGDVVLHNHPSGELEPSDADIAVASTLGDAGVGSYIIDNACERVRIIVKAFRPRVLRKLDPEAVGRLLGPKGLLAKSLADYEFRPQQVEMARAIARAFNEDRIAVIEAGTGVGKSMAYLLPAIRWALDNGQRVVVSTNTINLQEQLIRRDIPLLQKHSGLTFASVLVKGRGNYVCLRRVYFVRGEAAQPEFESFRTELKNLVEWALATQDGSLADLAAKPGEEAWDLIKCETESCTRAQCPYYHRCFFYEARRAASRAQIIVCNHHILLADLVVREQTSNYTAAAILPPFQRLILDEAHNLEEVATTYLGLRLTRRGMRYLLGRIYAAPAHKRPSGIVALALRKLATSERQLDAPEIARTVDFINHRLIPLIDRVRHHVDFECGRLFDEALDRTDKRVLKPGEEAALRITPEIEAHPFYEMTLVDAVHTLATAFGDLAKALGELAALLEDAHEALGQEKQSLRLEVAAYRDRALDVATSLAGFLTEKDGHCRWLELRRQAEESIVRLCSAPVEVGPGLRRTLFDHCPTVVLTSATLTVDRRFDYILERLGLRAEPPPAARRGPLRSAAATHEWDAEEAIPEMPLDDAGALAAEEIERRLLTLGLDTPFDFDRQAFVAVPTDVAEPAQREFARDIERLILESVRITKGRAFVLFTSYSLLRQIYDALKGRLEIMGCTPMKQGAINRHILLNRFRSARAPVLFATSSFWEGVDVKGDALTCLILTRLPFRVPTDPIVQARVEYLERKGRNAFEEFTVPQAVIKFKQGFGRLIRHKEDRGAVLILDRRVATKRYGAMFLRSLPTRTVHQLPGEHLLDAMRRFFGEA